MLVMFAVGPWVQRYGNQHSEYVQTLDLDMVGFNYHDLVGVGRARQKLVGFFLLCLFLNQKRKSEHIVYGFCIQLLQ